MRIGIGMPGQGVTSQVDSANRPLGTRESQLSQRPQPPRITGSGAIADDGNRASVRPLQLRQKEQKPLQDYTIGSLAGHAAASVLLSLAKLETNHGWPQSLSGRQQANLEHEILELVSPPPRTVESPRSMPTVPVDAWPSPRANMPPRAYDSIVPVQQKPATLGTLSQSSFPPGAFKSPRPAPLVPTALGASVHGDFPPGAFESPRPAPLPPAPRALGASVHGDFPPGAFESPRPAPLPPGPMTLGASVHGDFPPGAFESPRPAPPVPAARGAGYSPPAMEPASPPTRNKLRKDPPAARPLQPESSVSRLMNKIAPPVRNKLQKAPPPPKAPKQENSISRLMNKIAPPVRNKVRKDQPPSSSTRPIISYPILQPNSWSQGLEADALRPRPEAPSAPPAISHPQQPYSSGLGAGEDDAAQQLRMSIGGVDGWSMTTSDEDPPSRFLSRCTAQVKALLRTQ